MCKNVCVCLCVPEMCATELSRILLFDINDKRNERTFIWSSAGFWPNSVSRWTVNDHFSTDVIRSDEESLVHPIVVGHGHQIYDFGNGLQPLRDKCYVISVIS